MNILFLDQFSDLGGAQRCLLELLPAIRERGWQAHVSAPGCGPLRERAIELGATYRQIRCGPYESGGKSIADVFRFAGELPGLAHEIAGMAADCRARIVYVNGPRLLPSARLAAPERMVFHCHSYLRQRYAATLAGVAAAGATVIANCRFVAGPLRLYASAHIVYNGVDCSAAVSRTARTNVRRIGVLGRIEPEKGQLEFLQAARRLGPGFEFVICGAPRSPNDTYYTRVIESASGLPVEFLGWREDAASVLAGLDLLIVPSGPYEATTRVILEGWSAGVPVIASNAGGIPEIVRDRETGFLTPPNDPVRLAARISEAAANPAALQRIAEAAYKEVRKLYTLGQYQVGVMSILEGVGNSART